MPLLADSKSVYVGNTPITRVMAGTVQVWPHAHDNCDGPGRPARPEHLDVTTTSAITPKWNCAIPGYNIHEPDYSSGWYWTSEIQVYGSALWTNFLRIEYPAISHNYYKTSDLGSSPEDALVRVQVFKPSGENSCYTYANPGYDFCDKEDHPEELKQFSVGTFGQDPSMYACQTSTKIQPGEYWTTEIKKFDSDVWSNLQIINYDTVPNWYTTYDKDLFGDNRSDRMKSEVKAILYNAAGKQSCPVFTFPIN